MIAVSIIIFTLGLVVFILFLKKQKDEEKYYDRFYFIHSDNKSIDEYLSIINRYKQFSEFVINAMDGYVSKFVVGSEYYELFKNAGYYRHRDIAGLMLKGTMLFIAMNLYIIHDILLGNKSFVWFCITNAVFYVGAKIFLEKKAKAERNKFRANFVYFLDLLSTCIKTGMTLNVALDAINPLLYRISPLLGMCISKFNVSVRHVSIQDACDNFYSDVAIDEVREFNATLKNSIQFGTGMSSSLATLANEIRKYHYLETEEKIGGVNAKIGIPLILFIMFPIIVEIISPGLLRMMDGYSMGS